MANYDFQNDFQNDAARKNYDAAMSGETRKGVDFFEKPLTWDEEKPCEIKDSPRENFVPIPEINTGEGFATYSLGKKIGIIAGISLAVLVFIVSAVTFLTSYYG